MYYVCIRQVGVSFKQFSCCFQYEYYLTKVFSLVGALGTAQPFTHDLGISFCANESADYYEYSLEGLDSKTFRFTEGLANFVIWTLTQTSSTVPSSSLLDSELQRVLSLVSIKGDGHLHLFFFPHLLLELCWHHLNILGIELHTEVFSFLKWWLSCLGLLVNFLI